MRRNNWGMALAPWGFLAFCACQEIPPVEPADPVASTEGEFPMTSGFDDDDGVNPTTDASDSDSRGPRPSTASDSTGGNDTDGTAETSETDSTDTVDDDDGTPAPMVCPTFIDTFDTPVVDARWTRHRPSRISQGGGAIQFTLTPEPDDGFIMVQLTPEVQSLDGFTAKAHIGNAPNVDGVQMMLWLNANQSWLSFTVQQNNGIRTMTSRVAHMTVMQPVYFVENYDATAHAWIQMREVDGVLHLETSADGVSFDHIFSVATPFDLTNGRLGLVGNNFVELEGEPSVTFREFQIDCPSAPAG